MRRFMGAAMAVLAAATPANAACWSVGQAGAAQVRDLQTFLMVETLRCQAIGFDIAPDYNDFVRGNRVAIGQANDRLKAFFIASQGPVQGQGAYDRFTTSLANSYGGGRTSRDSCTTAGSMAREAALMENSHQGLLMIAVREGLAPRLPGGLCGGETTAQVDRQVVNSFVERAVSVEGRGTVLSGIP